MIDQLLHQQKCIHWLGYRKNEGLELIQHLMNLKYTVVSRQNFSKKQENFKDITLIELNRKS